MFGRESDSSGISGSSKGFNPNESSEVPEMFYTCIV